MDKEFASLIIDYHMHLERDDHVDDCRFTVPRIELYVQQAKKAGLGEIGITEHCNRFSVFEPLMRHLTTGEGVHHVQSQWMARSFRENLNNYVDAIERAKSAGMPVKTSLEVDFLPGKEEATRDILDRYPFDYVIGSVHFLDQWGIDFAPEIGWPEANVDDVYMIYFKTMCQSARSGLFDILAHPDLVKKFGHRPGFDLTELYDELALTLKENGVAAEINTAGLYKQVAELYPNDHFLDRLFDRGVPITLASDAHEPEHVGRAFDKALTAAYKAGYRTMTRFENKRPTQVPLG